MQKVPSRERLIAALDVPDATEARSLAERLGDEVRFYKIGLELFTAGGYFTLLEWLRGRGARVFADLKLYDIPETVRRAVVNLRSSGASFLTVHAERSIVEAAAKEKGGLKVLGVTVLTSFDQRAVAEMGYGGSLEDLVVQRARVVLEAGGDGVIASGLEAPRLRQEFGDRLLIVTPGVRPAGAGAQDQKRVVDVAQAFANGADYIVVGRPIRDAADPRAAAASIQATIAAAFER